MFDLVNIRAIFRYAFPCTTTNTAQMTRNTNDVCEADTNNERAMCFWFARVELVTWKISLAEVKVKGFM